METMRQPYGCTTAFSPSKVNFFGSRARVTVTAPRSEKQPPKTRTGGPGQIDTSAGRSYVPSNGGHRHLNFLGRTSWDSRERLLVNRI